MIRNCYVWKTSFRTGNQHFFWKPALPLLFLTSFFINSSGPRGQMSYSHHKVYVFREFCVACRSLIAVVVFTHNFFKGQFSEWHIALSPVFTGVLSDKVQQTLIYKVIFYKNVIFYKRWLWLLMMDLKGKTSLFKIVKLISLHKFTCTTILQQNMFKIFCLLIIMHYKRQNINLYKT